MTLLKSSAEKKQKKACSNTSKEIMWLVFRMSIPVCWCAISGIKGAMNALISSELTPDQMREELKKVPSMDGLELSSVVSTKEPYLIGDPKAKFKVAALDLGIKTNILRNLAEEDVI
jgi:hypothetical protein